MNRVNRIYEKSIFLSISYQLKDLTILNSRAIIHIFNNLSWFSNFQKALHGDYLITRDFHISILEYDDIILWPKNGNSQILRLKDVVYYINFTANLVSFSHLMDKGIHWNMIGGFLFWESDSLKIIIIKMITY